MLSRTKMLKFLQTSSALLLGWLAFSATTPAQGIPTANTGEESDFLPAIEMSPFVVEGDSSAIFVHARSRGDRRYAEKFAEDVVQVTYDSLGQSTGRGLVIIGRKNEPHPLFVFQKFIAMADAGQLDESLMPFAEETRAKLAEWEDEVDVDDADMDLTFDMVAELLPLPLDGPGSKLYQWAWLEKFDMDAVEQRFGQLQPEDFESDQLATYDWVFYLPPKSAVHRVIKRVIPKVMEAEDMGFFARTAVKGALLAFRPVITKAMEGMRKGMLFYAISDARTEFSDDDLEELAEAYVEVLMPNFKFEGSEAKREDAVAAIQRQLEENLEYAKDPFVAPEHLDHAEPESYATFVGDYYDDGQNEVTHRFRIEEDTFTWTYREQDPMVFYPASDHMFVREDDEMTIEFLVNEDGDITGVEERWHRRRKTVLGEPTVALASDS